ncbi:DUF4350 domain-containing protein [Pelotalea chapellei]|uniref:DUF4350 domain-containing protein n=1 Tax=Pelotalea chapellei TaxID=44671 RepID=A0ABS5UBU8_9BACT|nr:DUF4350 domain-containing protein [Pelotalea chapellei]MBT1073134.1 DUF4350 domain-containing protein [Pelotalea chapellei]
MNRTIRKIPILLLSMLFLLPLNCLAKDDAPRILFDQGHNQRFLIGEKGELQLSKLADTVRKQGAQVNSTTSPLSNETLGNCEALVISGPFAELTSEESDAVLHFLERGGRLAVMLHIGQPVAGLLARLNVEHSNAVLHERRNILDMDINFTINDLKKNPLFNGISQFSVYGAWALNPGPGSTAIASTSPESWVDLNGDKTFSKDDANGPFALVVWGNKGKGSFIIFGDDAIFQNRFLDKNNAALAVNLAAWLAHKN